MQKLRFIDLFAGLGGFHAALQMLGHKCVFACEIDETLADLYDKNFGIKPHGDIRTLELSAIPRHDILCAGFPCQPFSKAGKQQGFECSQWGDLFDYVVRILRVHKPKYFILENVPNLIRHQQGQTWITILRRLRLAGYSVDGDLLSPHQFGVPQIRKRAFIVGQRGGLNGFSWPGSNIVENDLSVHRILDKNPSDAKSLPLKFIKYLEAWQNFLDLYPDDEALPSFPIWAMEFGASYPYQNSSPFGVGLKRVGLTKGSFGQQMIGFSESEVLETLPAYAREKKSVFPKWKVGYIRQNRELYEKHKSWIDEWLPQILCFNQSFQKFEWNCKGEKRSIWKNLIQFRASGIRVKRPTTAPSLVAMGASQVPVIAWERRFMSIRECSRLQSMGALKCLPENYSAACNALGNAVNVDVVRAIANELLTESIQNDESCSFKSENKTNSRLLSLASDKVA